MDRRDLRWLCALVLSMVSLGCGGPGSTTDAGREDAGGVDAPGADAPTQDAPGVDAPTASGRFVLVDTAMDEPQWRETYPTPCYLGDALQCEAHETGGGMAIRDVDGDGDLDVFLTHFEAADVLYLNDGGFVFRATTIAAHAEALYTNGAAFADIDEDGDADLLVGTVGEDRFRLLIGDGAGNFTDEAVARGVAQTAADEDDFHSTMSHCFADYDLDGFLDLATSEWRIERATGTSRNALLRNRGTDMPGFFTNETEALGIDMIDVPGATAGAWGFTPILADMDGDDRPDLFFASDFESSRVFWNDGATFSDGTDVAMVGTEENGMGGAIGDYDGDGDFDYFVTSIDNPDCAGCEVWGKTGNRLYRNDGGRRFTDVTDAAGVRGAGWAWGTRFFDYDLDGDLDLIATNGMRKPPATTNFATDPTRLWRNEGDGTFTEVAGAMGLDHVGVGRGVATFDADGDGDLDVLITHNLDAPVLYRNDVGVPEDGVGRAWLEVQPQGSTSNRDGMGAIVRVVATDGAAPMVRLSGNGCGFLAHTPGTPHFGLGDLESVARIEVFFPASGRMVVMTDVATRQRLVVVEPDA